MKPGSWLAPRYPSKEIFEKDFSLYDPRPLEVYCPGCKAVVPLSRKANSGRIGGWCKACNRGVQP